MGPIRRVAVPAPASPRHGTRRRVVAAVVLALLAVVAYVAGSGVRHEVWSIATDRIAGPDRTWPAEPWSTVDPPTTRLAAIGDVGTGDDRERATTAAMDRVEGDLELDALLLLGDNVYPSGDPDRVAATVFRPLGPVLDGGTELVPVLGNHDVRHDNGDRQAAALGMPGRWYSTVVDDALIVALDSTRPQDPDQLAWLRAALEADSARWTIVIMHHPPYSAGYHGSSRDVRDAFSPLFERFGVDLVLSGHDHDYQRSEPIGGVTYVVSGGGAKTRRTGRADFTEVSWSTHHFVDLAVWPDRLELRAVDQDGREFDHTTLRPVRS